MDNILIKKVCSITALKVVGVLIIMTAFVFGREENKIQTEPLNSSSTTTTTSAVTTTVTSENNGETTVTTQATEATKPEMTTTSKTEVGTQESKPEDTVTTTTKKPQETTTTTKKNTTTTTTTKKKNTTTTKKQTTTTTKKNTTTTKKQTTTTKKPVNPPQNNGKLTVSVTAGNSWEENGNYCTQIDIVITNNTGAPINTFDTTINLGQNFEIVNSWNADFTPSGSNLRVSKTLGYNLENGNTFNAGLIVKANSKINI